MNVQIVDDDACTKRLPSSTAFGAFGGAWRPTNGTECNRLGMCAYNFTFQSLDNLARNPVGCDPHLSSEAGPKPGSEEAAACQRHDWDPNRLYDEDAAELKEAAT